nr:hypothetical protein BHE74_00007654 [Ipomoea batatas]
MFAMAKNGVMRGLERNEAIVAQSSVKAPIPRPFMPEPICCAVTDLDKIKIIGTGIVRFGRECLATTSQPAQLRIFLEVQPSHIQNKEPTSKQRDFPLIKCDYNGHDPNAISGSISKGKPGVPKNADKHVLLHVKRARVKREFAGPEPGNPELGGGQRGGHEPSDGESCHLDGDLGDGQWLFPVREKLVEEGEEHAGEHAQDPHSEGPYGQGRVVGVGYG